MKNLKIKNKIGACMAVLLVCVACLNVVQIMQMSQINDQSTVIADEWLPSVVLSSQMNTTLSEFRVFEYSQITALTDEEQVTYAQQRDAKAGIMAQQLADYKKDLFDNEEKMLSAALETHWNAYHEISKQVDQLYKSGQKDLATQMLNGESKAKYEETATALDALVKYNTDGAHHESVVADDKFQLNMKIGIAAMIGIACIGLFAGFMIVRNVAFPIMKITEYMGVLASGDLSHDVPDRDRKDEVGEMAMAIQIFKENMVKAKDLEHAQDEERKIKEIRQGKVNAAIEKSS